MKRLEKQTAKQAATKTTQTNQKKPTIPNRPQTKPSPITTSAKSMKDTKIFGSSAYKRPQPDHGSSVSSFKNTSKPTPSSILKSSVQIKDVKKQPTTSQQRSVVPDQKHQSNKKITDLADILRREQVFADTMAKVHPSNPRSPLLKALHTGNFEFSNQSFSPLSSKKLDRELGISPQQTKMLDEPQMLLRSGNLASSSEKSVRESLLGKIEISQEYLDIQRIKYSNGNSRSSTPTKSKKVIFNDSIIIENTNAELHSSLKSSKQFRPVILHNTNSRGQSPVPFNNQKSPSVTEIRGPYNYNLNVNDISNALEELKKTERDLFPEKRSEPSEKQEEFQTLILNQTTASTGLQSHDFSLANASLSGNSSQRNSLGAGSIQSQSQQQQENVPTGEIKALLRNILIEGQVLWEVEWYKKETSFEDEEELKELYKQEFLKLKSDYHATRKPTC